MLGMRKERLVSKNADSKERNGALLQRERTATLHPPLLQRENKKSKLFELMKSSLSLMEKTMMLLLLHLIQMICPWLTITKCQSNRNQLNPLQLQRREACFGNWKITLRPVPKERNQLEPSESGNLQTSSPFMLVPVLPLEDMDSRPRVTTLKMKQGIPSGTGTNSS